MCLFYYRKLLLPWKLSKFGGRFIFFIRIAINIYKYIIEVRYFKLKLLSVCLFVTVLAFLRNEKSFTVSMKQTTQLTWVQ